MNIVEQEGGKHLGDHEGFDFAGVGNVWANAEVDHRTTAVYSGGGAVWNFSLDEVFLIFVVLKKMDEKMRKLVYKMKDVH